MVKEWSGSDVSCLSLTTTHCYHGRSHNKAKYLSSYELFVHRRYDEKEVGWMMLDYKYVRVYAVSIKGCPKYPRWSVGACVGWLFTFLMAWWCFSIQGTLWRMFFFHVSCIITFYCFRLSPSPLSRGIKAEMIFSSSLGSFSLLIREKVVISLKTFFQHHALTSKSGSFSTRIDSQVERVHVYSICERIEFLQLSKYPKKYARRKLR